MKNALICLEQLGIGGVETFTITQIEEFVRRNIKCYVLCRDGLLSSKIKNKKNIKLIEFDFQLCNEIPYEKSSQIEEIVRKNKIDFIYVHQFSCIPYILPVVFKTKVPYIAYLHNIVPKTCEWFMDTYEIYKILFPIYFECASKIIAITENVRKENIALFNIDKNKYITINNSLDFSKFPDKKITKIKMPFEQLLLFGRVSEQKRQSIYTAVDFYHYCKKEYNPNMKLTVVGDGEIYDEIVEKYKDEDIHFKGAVSDMAPEIEKADILLGVDRCMLEAVASKKPAVVCGYKNNIILITPKNIKKAIEENFTGLNLGDKKEELFQYSEEELLKILEENYKYIHQNLSITTSVFLDIDPLENNTNMLNLLKNINYYQTKINKLNEENKELFVRTQDLYKLIDKYEKMEKEIGPLYKKYKSFRKKLSKKKGE